MATIFVDIDATGVNNGSSWGNAFTDLQSALAIAGASDEIWVAEGTYLPTTDGDRDISFVINNGVQVYGGFEGNEIFLEQRDVEENLTILSGNIGDPSGQNDNSFHVVDITNSVGSTLIDGFTITEGQANGSGNDDGGGVIGIENASATLRNLIISNNFASDVGGGIALFNDNSPTIINVTFINNLASDLGGAIHTRRRSTLNVVDSLFINNQSSEGGAIYHFGDILNVTGSTFYNNQGDQGDAIWADNFNTSFTIINNIFWNDAAIDRTQIDIDDISGEDFIISNNIIKGGRSPLPGDGDIVGSGNITEDPLFVDPDNNDFRLQIGSPGIDGGNNDFNNLDTDIVGNSRIFNGTIDIGAYEYGLFLSIDDATVVETENDGANLEFTVNLVESLGQIATEEIAVNYTVIEDTAIAGSDYGGSTNGIVIFSPGQTEQTITVPILDDDLIEQPELLSVELSNVTGNASIVDDSAVGIIQDDDINKTLQLFRLRNNSFSSGTFLYAGAAERDAIINDPNSNFSVDGVNPNGTINPAFTASAVPGDGLLPFFRLESLTTPGTFLFVSTGEYNVIFAEGSPQSNQWRRQGFDAAGQDVPEFYLLSGSSETGTAFNRFQNLQNGTFLYAGPEETIGINSNPSLSSIFVDQGVAFKSLV